MTFILQDGRSGRTATVDSNNRLTTFSSVQGEETTEAINGNTYIATTSFISLTSANESGLLYFKNTDTVPWIMSRIFINTGTSNGTGHWIFKAKKSTTSGTLISGGSALTPQNLNFGSARELTATVLEGVEGSTTTDGTTVIETLVPSDETRLLIANNPLVIEPASTGVFAITPPVSNTSWTIQLGFIISRFTETT